MHKNTSPPSLVSLDSTFISFTHTASRLVVVSPRALWLSASLAPRGRGRACLKCWPRARLTQGLPDGSATNADGGNAHNAACASARAGRDPRVEPKSKKTHTYSYTTSMARTKTIVFTYVAINWREAPPALHTTRHDNILSTVHTVCVGREMLSIRYAS